MKKCLFLMATLAFLVTLSCSKKTATTASTKDLVESAPLGTITFEAANTRYSAEGAFKKWAFTNVDMKGSDIETLKATIAVDLNSVWEKSQGLEDHLRQPDFFHVEKYSTATIEVGNVQKKADGTYTSDMKLMMKGLSYDMTSDFEVTNEKPLHVKGVAMVNRNTFNLGGEMSGLVELVKVSYDTDLPK